MKHNNRFSDIYSLRSRKRENVMKIIRTKRQSSENKSDMFVVVCLVQSVAVVLVVISLWVSAKTDSAAFLRAQSFIARIFENDFDLGGYFTSDLLLQGETQGGETAIKGAASYEFVTQTKDEDKDEEQTTENNSEEAEKYTALEVFDTLSLDIVLPLSGEITSRYGTREHPVYSGESFHAGEDIAAAEGTAICAVSDGTVIETGSAEMAGNYVKIEHENGMQTLYCHCSEVYVTEGMSVRCGETVAAVGQTGLATGPHLHFELRINGESVDPEILLSEAKSVS